MTVMADIEEELQRTREALKAAEQIPHSDERISRKLVLLTKLDELAAQKAVAKRFAESPAPTKGVERRAITAEVRAKGRRLEGYAATFGAEARIGSFTETIAPGAFAASLSERADILALLDHDPGKVLARTRSGTLRLAEDSRGLAFDLDVPATTVGSDVLALAERGDIGGASFAFTVKSEKWDGERRVLESVDLHEVSVVSAWPAYEGTIVQARARSTDIKIAPRLAVARRYLESL
jgi:HK97 family phage prohead protease